MVVVVVITMYSLEEKGKREKTVEELLRHSLRKRRKQEEVWKWSAASLVVCRCHDVTRGGGGPAWRTIHSGFHCHSSAPLLEEMVKEEDPNECPQREEKGEEQDCDKDDTQHHEKKILVVEKKEEKIVLLLGLGRRQGESLLLLGGGGDGDGTAGLFHPQGCLHYWRYRHFVRYFEEGWSETRAKRVGHRMKMVSCHSFH